MKIERPFEWMISQRNLTTLRLNAEGKSWKALAVAEHPDTGLPHFRVIQKDAPVMYFEVRMDAADVGRESAEVEEEINGIVDTGIATYELMAEEEGKPIKVDGSFEPSTDNDADEEKESTLQAAWDASPALARYKVIQAFWRREMELGRVEGENAQNYSEELNTLWALLSEVERDAMARSGLEWAEARGVVDDALVHRIMGEEPSTVQGKPLHGAILDEVNFMQTTEPKEGVTRLRDGSVILVGLAALAAFSKDVTAYEQERAELAANAKDKPLDVEALQTVNKPGYFASLNLQGKESTLLSGVEGDEPDEDVEDNI